MKQKVKDAWSDLEGFQKFLLIAIVGLFTLGLFYPPAMEILMLPMAFMTCSG